MNNKPFPVDIVEYLESDFICQMLSVYLFNTLQIYYRHIVDVHEELHRKKYLYKYSILNFANFRPLYILTNG